MLVYRIWLSTIQFIELPEKIWQTAYTVYVSKYQTYSLLWQSFIRFIALDTMIVDNWLKCNNSPQLLTVLYKVRSIMDRFNSIRLLAISLFEFNKLHGSIARQVSLLLSTTISSIKVRLFMAHSSLSTWANLQRKPTIRDQGFHNKLAHCFFFFFL